MRFEFRSIYFLLLIVGFFSLTFCLQSVGAEELVLQGKSSFLVKTDDEISMNMQFNIPDIVIESVEINGQKYKKYSIEGEVSSGSPGQPDLPSIVRYVHVPPQSGIGLDIENLTTRTYTDVSPSLIQRDKNDGSSQAVFENPDFLEYDKLIKSSGDIRKEVGSDGFWPPEVAKVGKPAIMRGYRVVQLAVNSVRWNPVTKEIQIVESLDINLDYNSDENRINLVTNPERKRNSRYAYEIISNLVINPPAPPRDIEHSSGSILYVMGNWNGIAEDLEPLIEWRRRMGWTVQLHQTRNNRNRDAVRNEILEYYESENPPEYVILVGDADRDYEMACYVHANVGNPYETDHQYACLEGDDVLADVALGCTSSKEVGQIF